MTHDQILDEGRRLLLDMERRAAERRRRRERHKLVTTLVKRHPDGSASYDTRLAPRSLGAKR